MIDGKYHAERTYHGLEIVIDLAEIDGTYEVMAFYPKSFGPELACFRSKDLGEAISAYGKMLRDYPESASPLSGKYAKLRNDLKAAAAIGLAAAAKVDDTGTCNLDAASISLPRWNAEKIQQAADEAGCGCFVWNLYGKKRWVFTTPRVGQALKNETAAEAMTKALSNAGYDAVCYCQMD